LAGTIIVDRIESDASYTSTINVANRITFSNTVNFGVFAGTAPVAGFYLPTTNNLAFTTASTERMRIDSAGNVGIGTSSPTRTLDVSAASATVFLTSSTGTNRAYYAALNTGGGVYLGRENSVGTSFNTTAYASVVWSEGAYPLVFATNNTEKMRIDSSGNLYINTTQAAVGGSKLIVNSGINTSSTQVIEIQQATNGTNKAAAAFGVAIGNGGQATNAADLTISTASGGSLAERMRILSGGEVCIKTTSALNSAPLTIGNGGANDFLAIRGLTGVDGVYVDWLVSAPYGSNSAEQNRIRSSISSNAANSGFQFMISDGAGASTQTQSFRINRTSCTVVGSLSKGSGSFKIDHPLPAKTDTHHLVHSFIEGPQADLIYRGKVNLVAGAATVNIDTVSGMTEGTFEVLCRDVQCFTTNESDWTAVRGSVTGNILTIEAQDNTSTASISWMVIGERKDKHMYDTDWTDESGKVIVEPLKEALENR
jgi:hypothetical protein